MIKKPAGYDEAAAYTGESQQLPKGKYVCVIKQVATQTSRNGNEQFVILFDVAEGEQKDFYQKDYVIRNITYKSQKLLNNSKKLAFDNTGISQLEGVVTNAMREAFLSGIIAQDDEGQPMYSTNFATRADIPAADRAARNYKGGKFSFSLAGAIHYATINGTIEE